MAQISVTIPDELKDRVIDALCGQYGRPETVNVDGVDVPNPTTKNQFAQNIVKSFIKEVVMAYEANKAGEVARKAALNKAKDEILI